MPSASKPSFKFWYAENWYTVQGAETLFRTGTKDDIATMKAEYTRMRDVAQKRIKRLAEKFPESKAYQYNQRGFAKLKELDIRDLPKAFAELAKFVKAKSSTVSGQREIKQKTIKTWQDQGLNLNAQNYDKTIKILEEMRKQKLVYGSDKAVELADSMLELDDQQTNQWLDHLDQLLQHTGELKEIPELSGYSFDEILQKLGE